MSTFSWGGDSDQPCGTPSSIIQQAWIWLLKIRPCRTCPSLGPWSGSDVDEHEHILTSLVSVTQLLSPVAHHPHPHPH